MTWGVRLSRRSLLAGSLAGLLLGASRAGAKVAGSLGELPDVAIRRVDGSTLRLGEYRSRVLLINFWASWCGPCMQELPQLESLHRKLRGEAGIALLAVNVEEGVSVPSRPESGVEPVPQSPTSR
jgi:thiol-disulfide isomerase/thioredoxin